jgi:OHCU decarboxylase
MTDAGAAITSAREGVARGVAREVTRGLGALNGPDAAGAHAALRQCCASERWVSAMTAGRPYVSAETLFERAEAAFDELTREDWLQAFAAHARIGAPRPGDEQGASEQAGVASASAEERGALTAGNDRYEARFGHVFLIRARGLDGAQMLAALRERLENPPALELEIAAAQQREITRQRLQGLLAP